jgi:predicted HTH domain antitoxin
MPHQLNINYPENIPDALNTTRGEFEDEAKMAMAVKLFEMKRLSSGMAADLLGMNRVTFLMTLHRYGVSAIDLEAEELLEDVKNA